MVGNDVVDLRDRDTDPSTLSARFDQRVFAEDELALLSRSAAKVSLRWTLWAAKEAAYKLIVKRDPGTIFSPVRFRVRLCEDAESGVVEAGGRVVPVRIREEEGAIHAVAVASSNSNDLIVGVLRVRQRHGDGRDLGRAVRNLATTRIADWLQVDPGEIEIRKRGRVPELFIEGARASCDLSLAHHGDVVAFAFGGSS
jgi:phosphopantetheinyl transferase (holo-ACP synthase)